MKDSVRERFGSRDPVLAGNIAPDFELPDVEGEFRRLPTKREKDVLLVFGNSKCPHCSDKISLLNEINDEPDGDFEVIFVALGDKADIARNYVKDKDIKFTVLVDTYGMAGKVTVLNVFRKYSLSTKTDLSSTQAPRMGRLSGKF